jgi:hypothetical protein
VTLSTGAQPWADLLMYETRVDGKIFRPQSSIAPSNKIPEAATILFTECDGLYAPDMTRDDGASEVGLQAGQHDVVLEAQLPGAEAKLASAAVSVALSCPESGVVSGAGVPADPAQGDRVPADSAAIDQPDGASSDDDDDEDDVKLTKRDDSGCTVRLAESHTHARGAWLSCSLLALGLVWSRRRRRRP